eukprot:9740125-Alexandrium_andersonii.AAC.1
MQSWTPLTVASMQKRSRCFQASGAEGQSQSTPLVYADKELFRVDAEAALNHAIVGTRECASSEVSRKRVAACSMKA